MFDVRLVDGHLAVQQLHGAAVARLYRHGGPDPVVVAVRTVFRWCGHAQILGAAVVRGCDPGLFALERLRRSGHRLLWPQDAVGDFEHPLVDEERLAQLGIGVQHSGDGPVVGTADEIVADLRLVVERQIGREFIHDLGRDEVGNHRGPVAAERGDDRLRRFARVVGGNRTGRHALLLVVAARSSAWAR